MMTSKPNTTLDRIQREIRESIQREKELKNGYTKLTTNGICSSTQQNEHLNNNNNCNGSSSTLQNGKDSSNSSIINENEGATNNNSTSRVNTRKFVPNSHSTNKFVMQKFLKCRGKLSTGSIKTSSQNNWASDAAFKPAKITVEKGGKPLRNGFVPAEEKMKKELQEFQIREQELRQERRKSQPNLMAALNLEEENEFQNGGGRPLFLEDCKFNGSRLKPTKSMANLYNNGQFDYDDGSENNSSAPSSLKPARSLADLCDVSDDEIDLPGTHSLIKQFESMKTKEKTSK